MKNLIYMTTFLQKEYGDMAILLLDSIIKYYNNDSFELYIFVDNITKNIIKNHLENKNNSNTAKINFQVKLIQCNINNVVIASAFRMFIFDYIKINDFNKILYLDTDVLINKSLDSIFAIEIDNKLHASMEGGNKIYHCMYHTDEEFEKYKDNDCFSAGILLFDTTLKEYIENVKNFFINGINTGIKIGCCIDQPFFNLIAHRMNCINNKIISKYLRCNPLDITEQIISHFAGNVGHHESKLSKMNAFILQNNLL